MGTLKNVWRKSAKIQREDIGLLMPDLKYDLEMSVVKFTKQIGDPEVA